MSLAPETRQRIEQLVASAPVFLFMKGNPDAPQCGFSSEVVQILNRLVPSYGSFDVLSDADVRDGIKDFAEWPTIPQLYVNGEFMGGCDIIKEMYGSGELQASLGLPRPDVAAPTVEITDVAATLLREASEKSGGAHLHLAIDARFDSSLGLGPAQPGEVTIEASGLTLHMDEETAIRASGVCIDAVETPEGPRLTINNPNAPTES